MLNFVWAFLLVASVLCAIFTGRTELLTTALAECGKNAISLFLNIFGIMVLWSGLMKIAERSGMTAAFTKLLHPIIHFILPKLKRGGQAEQFVSLSLCAELMGLGNAGTPIGIKTMQAIAKEQPEGKKATSTMITFVVMNTASLQLIPTTVGALRASAGSVAPFSILPAVWITSLSAFIIGILACRIFERMWPS